LNSCTKEETRESVDKCARGGALTAAANALVLADDDAVGPLGGHLPPGGDLAAGKERSRRRQEESIIVLVGENKVP